MIICGAEDIVFEGSDKSEAPAGLLPNLGRAEAMNYFLDLTYGPPLQWVLDFSDETTGWWRRSMGKSVRWKFISKVGTQLI